MTRFSTLLVGAMIACGAALFSATPAAAYGCPCSFIAQQHTRTQTVINTRISQMEESIVTQLKKLSDETSVYLDEQSKALLDGMKIMDDREVTRKLEDVKYKAAVNGQPTKTQCVSVSSMTAQDGGQAAATHTRQTKEEVEGVVKQWLAQDPEGPSRNEQVAARNLKATYCEKSATEADVKAGICEQAAPTEDQGRMTSIEKAILDHENMGKEDYDEATRHAVMLYSGGLKDVTLDRADPDYNRKIVAKKIDDAVRSASLSFITQSISDRYVSDELKANTKRTESAKEMALAAHLPELAADIDAKGGASEAAVFEIKSKYRYLNEEWAISNGDKSVQQQNAEIMNMLATLIYQNWKLYDLNERAGLMNAYMAPKLLAQK